MADNVRHIDESTEKAREAVRELRDSHDQALCDLLRDLIDTQKETREEIRNLRSCMMDVINRAFPGGDYESHGRYHEAQMEWLRARTELVRGCIREAAKVGGLAGMAWIIYALWKAIKTSILS